MVESSIGALWRTDSHHGEVEVLDGVGGDRGGNWRFLPLFVRLPNQDSSANKSKTDDPKPQDLYRFGLKGNYIEKKISSVGKLSKKRQNWLPSL